MKIISTRGLLLVCVAVIFTAPARADAPKDPTSDQRHSSDDSDDVSEFCQKAMAGLKPAANATQTTLLAQRALCYGNFQYQKGRYESAVNSFGEAIRLDPGYVDAYNNRGATLVVLRRFDSAIADLSESIRLNAGAANARAFANRGLAYSQIGKYDLAIDDYNTSLRLDPNDAISLKGRGMANEDAGNYDQAIADFTESLRLMPFAEEVLVRRGDTYRKKGSYDLSAADYTQALQSRPKDVRALVGRAIDYGADGQYDLETLGLKQALSYRSDDAAAEKRCFAQAALGVDLELGLAFCEHALRENPSNVDAMDSRGLALLRQGQYSAAIEQYDAANAAMPHRASVLFGRGIEKQLSGDKSGGQLDIDAAVAIDPKIAKAYRFIDQR